jgi:biopolymer transport protein TolR
MAGYLNGSPGRGRRGRYRPLAEINVTPLVDVMLVLLIIFMVTAPLMTSGVPVDLPKTSAAPLNSDSEPLTVSIDAQGTIFLQDQQVEVADLVTKLQAIAQNNADRRIFVRGDKDLAYGKIMEVMGTITQGGFTKVALLAEQPAATPAGSTAPPALAAPSVPTPSAPAATTKAAPAPAPAAKAPSGAPTRKGG